MWVTWVESPPFFGPNETKVPTISGNNIFRFLLVIKFFTCFSTYTSFRLSNTCSKLPDEGKPTQALLMHNICKFLFINFLQNNILQALNLLENIILAYNDDFKLVVWSLDKCLGVTK